MINTPDPSCELECRLNTAFSMSTIAHYTPIYDKNGVNVNIDRNTTFSTVSCFTCNKRWSARTFYKDGKYRTDYEVIS